MSVQSEGPEEAEEPDPPELFSLERLSPRMRALVEKMTRRWPGRIGLASARAFARLEIFDRSMTIAAQFFTSVFPLLIILSVSLSEENSDHLADWLNLPAETKGLVDDAVTSAASTSPYWFLSLLIVLASGTSLSRALTRAFAKIWNVPKPKSKVRSAWRWLAVLAIFSSFLVFSPLIPTITTGIPPSPTVWRVVLSSLSFLAISGVVPWILLEHRVTLRMLAPGALLFAILLVSCRPLIHAYLPRALESSADHYGTIGVAFAFITFLYMVFFGYLGCATLGSVLARDDGWLGRLIRGEKLRRPTVAEPA